MKTLIKFSCLCPVARLPRPPSPTRTIAVTLKNHKFSPSVIKVKANQPSMIILSNDDDTADEFDSSSLKVEKVVPGHAKGNVRIRALAPGKISLHGRVSCRYCTRDRRGRMISALIIVFREVIEAGLIVGIVLAATAGVPTRSRYVALGVAAGVLGACLVAAFAGELAKPVPGFGAGVLQRHHPASRRLHAHLAQCLDGKPWPARWRAN